MKAMELLLAIVKADDNRNQLGETAKRTAKPTDVKALIEADHERAKRIDEARKWLLSDEEE